MVDSHRADTQATWQERILKVLVHLQHDLDAEHSLEELAAIAHFSPYHFHRIFSGMVGESLKQHVRRLRLERAAQRLKWTERSVTDIAFEAGYETHESFTRAFRSAFDMPPKTFRENSEQSATLPSPTGTHFIAADDTMHFTPSGEHAELNPVEIRILEPMRCAFVRHIGPYDQVGTAWERLTDWVGAECLFGNEHRFFGACWDDPDVTAPDRVRYDACITIPESVQPSGDIGVQSFPGGPHAVVLHEGPYSDFSKTYRALFGQWFPQHKVEPADGPALEFYLNDPESSDPEDLLTDICIRLNPMV